MTRISNSRRRFLVNSAAFCLGLGSLSKALSQTSDQKMSDRILVVLELSGGNDGLNTIVPYGDDAYYKARPRLGIRENQLLRMDDYFGMNPGLRGLHRLWEEGQVAVIHGCGYERPSYSHFNSIAYWRTGVPHQGDEYGWMGRLADSLSSEYKPNFLVNIDTSQSLAVSSKVHTPVVFSDPEKFQRYTLAPQKMVTEPTRAEKFQNASHEYLSRIADGAKEASALFQEAWRNYETEVDYGIFPVNLDKISAFIASGLPTRLYYTSFPNNSFDTHVSQVPVHQRLLSYVSDAIYGFVKDLERTGNSDRVTLLVFSEFGRRVPENDILGTDHGTANNMMLVGRGVKGGHYGELPSLTELNGLDNLLFTTDFRRVYATAIEEWMGVSSSGVLKGSFEKFPIFDSPAEV